MNGENVADLAKILSALADLIGMWGANHANAASNEEIHYKADAFEITMARAKSAQWAINDRAVAEIAEQERMERVHERLAEVRAERAQSATASAPGSPEDAPLGPDRYRGCRLA